MDILEVKDGRSIKCESGHQRGSSNIFQSTLLLLGLIATLTLAFIPGELNLQPAANSGGISEPQSLSPDVAEDPDAKNGSTATASSTQTSNPSGEFPFRQYAAYPLIAALLLTFFQSSRTRKTTSAEKDSGQTAPIETAKPIETPKPIQTSRPIQTSKPIQTPTPLQTPKPIEIHERKPVQSQPQKPISKVAPAAPADHTQKSSQKPPQTPTKMPAETPAQTHAEQAAQKPSLKTSTKAASDHSNEETPQAGARQAKTHDFAEIRPSQMIEFANVLNELKSKNIVSAEKYKELHASFQAKDGSGNLWTVGVKTLDWFEMQDGKWLKASCPNKLLISIKTIETIAEYSRLIPKT